MIFLVSAMKICQFSLVLRSGARIEWRKDSESVTIVSITKNYPGYVLWRFVGAVCVVVCSSGDFLPKNRRILPPLWVLALRVKDP